MKVQSETWEDCSRHTCSQKSTTNPLLLSSQPTMIPSEISLDKCCGPPWIRRILPRQRESAWVSADEENGNPAEVTNNNFGRVLFSPLECDGSFETSNLYSKSPFITTKDRAIHNDKSKRFPDAVHPNASFTNQTPNFQSTNTLSTQEESDDTDSDDVSTDQSVEGIDYTVEIAAESTDDLLDCPRILTNAMIQQLHHFLPDALKMNPWHRCFAIGRDGDSFIKLLDSCSSFNQSILVIRTVQGHVLGGFASQAWRAPGGYTKSSAYYGTGQSFLFGSHPEERISGLDAEPLSVPENMDAPLQIFAWTGSNDYCQICDTYRQVVCMGGEGDFGWIIRENFARGQSGRCRTYKNPPLVPGGLFEIADVEVYGLQSIFDSSFIISSSRI